MRFAPSSFFQPRSGAGSLQTAALAAALSMALAGPAQARTEAPATPPPAPAAAGTAPGQPQTHLPRTEMRIGMYRIEAQVAHTYESRQTGLMYRQSMPAHEGMLFAFPQPGVQCFWMRNTVLPLTAAFVADDGTIVNLADMQPLRDDSHCSAKPVRFVLEMNQGWFAQRGIKAGAKISGEAFRP